MVQVNLKLTEYVCGLNLTRHVFHLQTCKHAFTATLMTLNLSFNAPVYTLDVCTIASWPMYVCMSGMYMLNLVCVYFGMHTKEQQYNIMNTFM